ncbi:MAG: hypothetical protein AAFN51_10110 [Pseudomonadota bacterium]
MKRFVANGAIALTVLSNLSTAAKAEQPITRIDLKPPADVDPIGVWSNGLRWNGLRWNGLRWNGLPNGPEGQSQSENRSSAKPSPDTTNPFSGLADRPIGK